jgi:hypothetical protein
VAHADSGAKQAGKGWVESEGPTWKGSKSCTTCHGTGERLVEISLQEYKEFKKEGDVLEKPILFSTPMVQAILDGRKAMTRRIIKPQPEFCIASDIRNRQPLAFWVDNARWVKPRYQPGDILWVRETWSRDESGEYVYRTNYGTTEDDSFPPSMFRWRPSIHMPKSAARIWLEVTNVRVERVQEITAHECILEGISSEDVLYNTPVSGDFAQYTINQFKNLWNSINAKRGYGWDTNPWVWVIEFERIDANE